MRQRLRTLIMALALMAPAAGTAASSADPDGASRNGLTGTWLVTATFTDPADIPPFKVLITFIGDEGGREGTLVDTNAFELTPNPICTPDQGSWKQTGGREFVATHLTFCFDAEHGNAPAGLTKVRDALRLSPNGRVLTGYQYVEGFDQDGALVFTGRVTLRGTRVEAEAPPIP